MTHGLSRSLFMKRYDDMTERFKPTLLQVADEMQREGFGEVQQIAGKILRSSRAAAE